MNSTKILELEDELSTSLRDAIAGRDEIERITTQRMWFAGEDLPTRV